MEMTDRLSHRKVGPFLRLLLNPTFTKCPLRSRRSASMPPKRRRKWTNSSEEEEEAALPSAPPSDDISDEFELYPDMSNPQPAPNLSFPSSGFGDIFDKRYGGVSGVGCSDGSYGGTDFHPRAVRIQALYTITTALYTNPRPIFVSSDL